MHRPAISDILKKNESYYSLVLAVAKRARDIVDDAENKSEILVEKPVSIAVDDFAKGHYKLIETAGIGEVINN